MPSAPSSRAPTFSRHLRVLPRHVFAHPLCVDLANVGQPLGQNIAGHFIAVLVPEFSGLGLGTLCEGASIGDGAGHYAAHRRGEPEDVGHRGRINEFILGMLSVYSGHPQMKILDFVPRRTGTFFWERTTAQSLPLMPIDMIFAAVIALNAYSAGRQRPLPFVIFEQIRSGNRGNPVASQVTRCG